MADIALLVVEEYERRVKHTATAEIDWLKIFPAKMTSGFDKMKIESFMKKFEAKSQFALAISHGLFSA